MRCLPAPSLLAISICLVVATSCDRPRTPDDNELLPFEVDRDIHAAREGDRDAQKRLAFHFATLDPDRSRRYLEQCVAADQPECLADMANVYLGMAENRLIPQSEKRRYLRRAKQFNARALANADPDDAEALEGFVAQANAIAHRQGELSRMEQLDVAPSPRSREH